MTDTPAADTTPANDGQAPPTAAPAAPQQPAEQPGQRDQSARDGEDTAATIARLERELKEARAEAGKQRVNAKTKAAEEAKRELAQEIGKAIGLVKDDADAAPDTAQLVAKAEAAIKENRELRFRDAVWESSQDLGADAKALNDSRSFLAKASALDPDANDFRSKVRDLVKKALEDNPRYRANGQAPAPRGGTEPPGRPGTTGKAATLSDAIAARFAQGG
ncbi:hypothetical protein [Thermomonospora cellulosilytica]|uniref:Membrane protein involved in colicin uptake n=1 Tax=Thermomonospora cellulosilytica TaxID=1411118 RepID=A0A7W3MXC8_9ACTN|nr:hypothetical protein [Thermomonospora cellulosilytica]MBA9003669.1 membrane protein involved in colicin uptake [Thermomonospora cellulosilytica]